MYRTKKRHWKIQKRRVNSHTKKAPKNNCWYFSPNHESKMYLVYWLPNSQRSQLPTQLNISNIIFCSNWWLWWLEWDWAHWLYLNSWFLVSRLFGKNEEVWPCCLVRIDVALLEEMDPWRWVLRFGNPLPSLASHNPLAPCHLTLLLASYISGYEDFSEWSIVIPVCFPPWWPWTNPIKL